MFQLTVGNNIKMKGIVSDKIVIKMKEVLNYLKNKLKKKGLREAQVCVNYD